MKMRTINSAFTELKHNDPDTAMTLSGLRRLVKTGSVPSINIGRRILVDYDGLVEYLRNPHERQQADNEHGRIRRIAI